MIVCWIWVPAIVISSTPSSLAAALRSIRGRASRPIWPPGIEHQVGSVTNLDFLDDGAVDFAFASNLFEHLTQDEFRMALDALRPKLSTIGTLTILQPNYRYAFREYFDDFDHKSIYTHVSLPDYLTANGYEVFRVEPRFMPLSVKSRLPVTPFLIRAWLAAPIKPMGKQMLVRARPRR